MSTVLTSEDLSISIVSHGHGPIVRKLLLDLQPIMQNGGQVLLTLNIPEDESFLVGLPFQPELIRNDLIKGFGENHNEAFKRVARAWFAVVNPDTRVESRVFEYLTKLKFQIPLGVIAPIVKNNVGLMQDSARVYPTIIRLIKRISSRLIGQNRSLDYDLANKNMLTVDWLSGCFMLFDSRAYSLVGGFDTSYFMYLEDADICYRLRLSGFNVVISTQVSIVHNARHASRTEWRHFRWHAISMLRFLLKNRKMN